MLKAFIGGAIVESSNLRCWWQEKCQTVSYAACTVQFSDASWKWWCFCNRRQRPSRQLVPRYWMLRRLEALNERDQQVTSARVFCMHCNLLRLHSVASYEIILCVSYLHQSITKLY